MSILQPNYNGAPFHVESISGEFGNRVVLHHYPFRNEVWVDNLGNLKAPLKINAFLRAADQAAASEQYLALQNKLESANIGVLEHLFVGRVNVQPGKCSWRINKRHLGVVNLTLEFYPPGENNTVLLTPQTDAIVDANINSAVEAAGNALDKELDVTASNLLERAQDLTTVALDGLRNINKGINTATAPISQIQQDITNIAGNTAQLIQQPRSLVAGVVGVFGSVYAAADTVRGAMSTYRNFSSVFTAVESVPNTTPTRQQQAANQTSLINGFNTVAVLEVARQVTTLSRNANISSNADSPFDSYDEAIAVRDEIIAALDTITLTADAELYAATTALINNFAKHINNHGIRLPRRATVSFPHALPALVIAHLEYGDASKVGDLIDRNAIANPLYIAANTELEVLRDA